DLGIGGERRLGSEGGGGKNAADHGEADLHGMSPLVCLGPGQPGLMQCQASSATMLAPAHMPFALGHSDGRRASATTDRGDNRTNRGAPRNASDRWPTHPCSRTTSILAARSAPARAFCQAAMCASPSRFCANTFFQVSPRIVWRLTSMSLCFWWASVQRPFSLKKRMAPSWYGATHSKFCCSSAQPTLPGAASLYMGKVSTIALVMA